jgi:hypothetical protein
MRVEEGRDNGEDGGEEEERMKERREDDKWNVWRREVNKSSGGRWPINTKFEGGRSIHECGGRSIPPRRKRTSNIAHQPRG